LALLAADQIGIVLEDYWHVVDKTADDVETYWAGIEMVLALCPNLSSLHLITDDINRYIHGSVLASSPKGIVLEHLRKLHVSSCYRHGMHLNNLIPLLERAPNLTELCLPQFTRLPPGLPLQNLKTLWLRAGIGTAEFLANLLAACPLLEDFTYESSGTIEPEIQELEPAELWRLLLDTHKGTLRHLSLDYSKVPEHRSQYKIAAYNRGRAVLGSKTEFPNLETFRVLPRYLIGFPLEAGDLWLFNQ
jgi:hypothetical protein